ncbi:MAG: sigma-70 family RNA polymerase sigma factor [Saprospiraceae bacterium]
MIKKSSAWTEEELVKGCILNDRLCQERLYRQFFPVMYRMCMRHTGDEEESLEILNAGFLRVFTKLHTFEFKGSLEGWIRRIVFHSLADHYRKADKKLRFMPLEDWDQPTTAPSLDNLYWEDMVGMIDQLPKATREVFWLFAVEGYTHVEIGEALGISAGTSKWHLSQAREKLKTILLTGPFKLPTLCKVITGMI